jgi:poly-beta-hydroxybutyrate-responsive repressor
MQPGLPRNFLRPCLLLLVAEQPSHGYDLLERLPALGYRQVDPGGLYRALRAMEQEGLVASAWEPSGTGPPRRRYALTAEGMDWLHAWAGTVRETRRVVELFLSRYDGLLAGVDGRALPPVSSGPARNGPLRRPAH